MTDWPSVGVVLPTRHRPTELKAALDSVLAQEYPGRLEAVVVHDRSEPDQVLADGDKVRVLRNARTPGLAGARPSVSPGSTVTWYLRRVRYEPVWSSALRAPCSS